MRTYVLILATLAVLGSAFYFYSREQTATVVATGPQDHHPEPPPATEPATNPGALRNGESPWVKFINAQGRVGSQYRAQEYLPRPDGTVHLIAPEADFFVGEHQQLHVTGVNGDVVMHTSSSGLSLSGNSQPSGQPTRGRLNDVHMSLVDETIPSNPVVVLTMTANNIEFDNDSFLITTGEYTSPDGKSVPPDQVPVQMRGEYEFDGRGLTLRWNDQDDRLEMLEIAHGEMLTILHPSNRDGPLGASRNSPATAPTSGTGNSKISQGQATIPTISQTPGAVNSATSSASSSLALSVAAAPAARGTEPAPAAKPGNKIKPIYVATFDRDVRITQGNDLLMTGDVLRMHFRLKDQPQATSTQPPASKSSHADIPAQQPFARVDAAGGTSACQAADPSSATAPDSASMPKNPSAGPGIAISSDVPIVVRWTGRLLIVPEPGTPPRPIGQGESVMELSGRKSAVYAFRAATEDSPASRVKCTKLTYATVDGSALLEGSREFGQVQITREPLPTSLDDDPMQPTVITTDTLDYVASAHMANLTGIGHAVIPTAPNPGEKPAAVDAKWSKKAHFDFLPKSDNEMAIQSATFDGDVKIDHPQLKLAAQELILAFNPFEGDSKSAQGGAPPLSEVKATDAGNRVDCQLFDASGKRQEVKSHFLDLHTARTSDNRVLARQVDAAGSVDATDGTQELLCDRVRMLLRPSTGKKPADAPDAAEGMDTSAVELDRMDARGNVIVKSKDGSRTQSDDLLVAMDPDGPHVMMTGNSLSSVIDAKGDRLTGEKIVIQPNQQIAHVIGTGTIHSPGTPAKASASGNASRKMDILFSEGADLDGGANQIKLRGHPVVTMPDSDGTINNAVADSIKVDLEDKPKTAAKPAAPRPAAAGGLPPDDANLLGNKEAKLITLDGNSVVQSTLSDATGILRQRELKAPVILYSVTGAADLPPRTLVVPSAGVMLVRDHRPPTTAPAAAGDDAGLGSGRGSTAFKWTKKLTYSEDDRRAVLSGDVLVVHESDNPKELPVNMTADEMTADFVPASGNKPAVNPPSANGADSGAKSDTGAMELKRLEATGNASVNRGPEQMTAPRMFFEPATHWMTAQGTSQIPATMTDAQGAQSSAAEMRWNTQTWDFSMKQASGEGRR
jgi:hypothetical protein